MLAPFVQQSVVHDQIQHAARIERDDDRHGQLMRQVVDCPGGSTEEVVKTVERMPLLPGKGRVGLDGLEHAELGPLA